MSGGRGVRIQLKGIPHKTTIEEGHRTPRCRQLYLYTTRLSMVVMLQVFRSTYLDWWCEQSAFRCTGVHVDDYSVPYYSVCVCWGV